MSRPENNPPETLVQALEIDKLDPRYLAKLAKNGWDALPLPLKALAIASGVTGAAVIAGKLAPTSEQQIISMTCGETQIADPSRGLVVQQKNEFEVRICNDPSEHMLIKVANGVVAFKAWYYTNTITLLRNGREHTIVADDSIRDYTLSKDGTKLAYDVYPTGTNPRMFTLIHTKDGYREISFEGENPTFSPNGEKVAFSRYDQATDKTSLYIYESYQYQPVGNVSGDLLGWDWYDDTKIIISSVDGETNRLVERDLASLEDRVIIEAKADEMKMAQLAVSPNKKHVGFVNYGTDISDTDVSFEVVEIQNPNNRVRIIDQNHPARWLWGNNGDIYFSGGQGRVNDSNIYKYDLRSNVVTNIDLELPKFVYEFGLLDE